MYGSCIYTYRLIKNITKKLFFFSSRHLIVNCCQPKYISLNQACPKSSPGSNFIWPQSSVIECITYSHQYCQSEYVKCTPKKCNFMFCQKMAVAVCGHPLTVNMTLAFSNQFLKSLPLNQTWPTYCSPDLGITLHISAGMLFVLVI